MPKRLLIFRRILLNICRFMRREGRRSGQFAEKRTPPAQSIRVSQGNAATANAKKAQDPSRIFDTLLHLTVARMRSCRSRYVLVTNECFQEAGVSQHTAKLRRLRHHPRPMNISRNSRNLQPHIPLGRTQLIQLQAQPFTVGKCGFCEAAHSA